MSQTLISRPFTTINISEPTVDRNASKFVYNYYTRDERLPIAEQSKTFSTAGYLTADQFNDQFNTIDNQGRIPRFNIIVFKSNHAEVSGEFTDDLTAGSSNLIDAFESRVQNGEDELRPDRIISEGTFANMFFNSVNLIDTNLDKSFYYFTNEQLLFNEAITGNQNGASIDMLQQRVDAYVNRSNQAENNPQIVRQFINQLNLSGQSVSEENDDEGTASDQFMLKVRRQSFLMGFNNLHIDNIMVASTDEAASVFEDEIRAMQEFTPLVQSKAVHNIDVDDVSIETYNDIYGLGFLHDIAADPERLLTLDDDEMSSDVDPPHVRHIGFVVNKRETSSDGSVTDYPAKFIGQKNASEIIDTEVTYGYRYTYKIRAVSAVEYDFIVKNNLSNDFIRLRGLFFVGSRTEALDLRAIETKPPRAPTYLRFNYERGTGLLIDWDPPINPQNDIIAYHIYRRRSTDRPFTLIREINFDYSAIKTRRLETAYVRNTTKVSSPQPYYCDKLFNNDSSFIYSVVSVDAHGMTSNYSPQYLVQYNRPTNKITVKTVSVVKAPKAYPNMYLNGAVKGGTFRTFGDGARFTKDGLSDFMQDSAKITNKKRMTVYFNPDYYHVFKKTLTSDETVSTENLKLFQANLPAGEPIYRIHLINTDLQKDNILNIVLNDESTRLVENPLAPFEENNFSFDLLHPDKYE